MCSWIIIILIIILNYTKVIHDNKDFKDLLMWFENIKQIILINVCKSGLSIVYVPTYCTKYYVYFIFCVKQL